MYICLIYCKSGLNAKSASLLKDSYVLVFFIACLPIAPGERSWLQCTMEKCAFESCRMPFEDDEEKGQSEPTAYSAMGDHKDFPNGLAACC